MQANTHAYTSTQTQAHQTQAHGQNGQMDYKPTCSTGDEPFLRIKPEPLGATSEDPVLVLDKILKPDKDLTGRTLTHTSTQQLIQNGVNNGSHS